MSDGNDNDLEERFMTEKLGKTAPPPSKVGSCAAFWNRRLVVWLVLFLLCFFEGGTLLVAFLDACSDAAVVFSI